MKQAVRKKEPITTTQLGRLDFNCSWKILNLCENLEERSEIG